MDAKPDGDLNPGPRGYALSGKVMLTSTVVLFAAVLLLLFLHLYFRSRFFLLRRRHRRLRRRLIFFVDGAGGTLPSSSSAAHRGLNPTVLKSLPVFVFAAAAGGEEGDDDVVECPVCLNEFEEGEKMRALPRCGHRFHIECIDMWFHSHATCPLCRSAVEASARLPLPTPANQVLLPVPAPPEPGRPYPADLFEECRREDGIGSSASSSATGELRIEVPMRGAEGEQGLGLKSPGSRMLLLTRFLSRDARVCRGGGTAAEPDPERGVEAANSMPPPPSVL
ncbi:RING-H2 finger protein ATL2-like [Musa acuminata AAA Group]|uniref:RING-H2 finger protein ATL2-like n=1 Tax=Musa acuminata AAA Group TaxID=214697 RepID=UPI0031DFD58E